MTSIEITHSPELLFSCYHFPRQHSCHVRPQVCVSVCVNFARMSDSGIRGNIVCEGEDGKRILSLNEMI